MSDRTPRPVRPADRYGEAATPARRWLARGAVGLLAVVGVAFLLWSALHHSTPQVRAGLLGYDDVTDRSVTVRFEVVKDADATAVCRVRAQNPDNVTVGSAELDVGPPEHGERSVVEVVLPTTERPVNGELVGCETR